MKTPVLQCSSQPTDKGRSIGTPLQEQVNVARFVGGCQQVIDLPQADVAIELPPKVVVTVVIPCHAVELCVGVKELRVQGPDVGGQVLTEPCFTKQMGKLLFRKEIPVRIL